MPIMSAHDDEDMPPPDVAPSAPTPAAAAAAAAASTDVAASAAASPTPSTGASPSATPTPSSPASSKGPSLSRAETCPAPAQNNPSDDEADDAALAGAAKCGGLETVEEDSSSGGKSGGVSKPSSAVAQAIAASAALRAASAAQRPSAASMSDSPSALHNLTKRSSVWVSLLQRSYNPPFLSPSASVLHHAGPLKKFGSKLTPSSLNGRFFHLVHHSLQYYKSNPFADPQGSIPLVGAVLTAEPESATLGLKPLPQASCCFSVTPRGSNRTYLFVTDDPNQRTVWLELLSFSTQDAKRAALQPQPAGRWNEDANLLVEGWITKRGGDAKALSWKKRYCVYMRATHTLVYLKSAPAKAAGFVPIEKGVVVDWVGGPKQPGANPELQKHSDRTLASLPPSVDSGSILACTQSDERCYVMLAASKAERDEWVGALRGAVAYCDGVTPSWEAAKNKQARISAAAAVAAAPAPTPATPTSTSTATPAPSAATPTAASSSAAAASPSSSSSSSAAPDSSRPKSESMMMDSNPLLAAAAVAAGAGAVAAVAVSSNNGGNSSQSASPVMTPKEAPGSGPSSAASTPAATPASTPQTKPVASPASPQASPAPSPQKVLSPSARQQSTPGPTPAASNAKTTPAAGASTAATPVVSSPNNDDDWDAATLTGVRTKGQSVSYINVQAAGVKPTPGPSSVAGGGASRLAPQNSRAKLVTTGSEVTATPSTAAAPAVAVGAATTTAGATTPAAAGTPATAATPAAVAADASPAAAAAAGAAADSAPVAVAVAAPATPAAPKSTGNVMLVEKSISELYSTEATYVGVLSTICNSYILRLRKHLELGLEPRWFDDAAELAQFHIFQHAVSIRDINARLLKELEAIASSGNQGATNAAAATTAAPAATTPAATPTAAPAAAAATPATPSAAASVPSLPSSSPLPEVSRMQHLSRIGSTFRQFIPFFKVYSSYAKSYDDVRAFEALADRRPSLKTFLALTDACEATTLSTLMITPVQRVGRYVMLLDTILKNVPRIDGVSVGVDGLADVELALDEMKKVATLINETVALWEATSKVVELQSKIDAPILQPGRYLVREGVLKKTYKREPGSGFFSSLAKKEAPFVFFLLNDALLQAKKATLGEKYKSVRSRARGVGGGSEFALRWHARVGLLRETHCCSVCVSLLLSLSLSLRATLPLHGMCLEDVPDSDTIKHAWSIYYPNEGGASGAVMPTTPASKQGGGVGGGATSDGELGSPGGVRHSRTESADTDSAPALSLGSGAAADKKAVLLYAKTAEEKAQWMSDITALIEANNKKKTSLIAGLARQGTQAQL